ncbi:DUF5330 domain-containing protein [Microbaculum marinisediminis]|uniref:DUF5330 domain-containing protein n=1 Tax=Microbaculum marinisediminis TaxID=2931392 RepID=A0AAW5QW49_9HYPH|nr:DUF5330 domain-containing protein [Microbaculum sp. A6E488]MCT8971245.1 DUF5330 domain-containing protein [Microbaculum sp. A6E488]
MFLIRTAFWLSLVILFIPTGESETPGKEAINSLSQVSTFEALSAAQSTMSDLAGFCERNPETCQTGSEALKVFGQKAQYGAKKLYEYIVEVNSDNGTDETISVYGGIDTLLQEDKDIPWQGPENQG